MNQVFLGVVEESSVLDMALYSIYQNSIHNIELFHDCYAISIVYQSMLWSFMSYAKDVVRPDDPGMNIDSLCFQACSSILLVHLKGGRPRDG